MSEMKSYGAMVDTENGVVNRDMFASKIILDQNVLLA